MQSIGERLEEARKRKGVTIREAAEATKIRGDYLNSFENNNFAIKVPDIYVRGFLRSYCNFLKVNSEKVITDYNANLLGEAKAAKREHREFFGRMELQQTPLVNEENKPAAAPPPEDSNLLANEDEEEKLSFFDKIDKEAAIKIGIVAVIAIMLLLVIIWLFRTLTSGGIDDADVTPNSTGLVPTQQTTVAPVTDTPTAATETIVLIATGDVRVSVTERNSGRVLLDYFPMVAGQRESIEKNGAVKIDYTAGENLQVEVKGTAYGTGKTGQNYSTIP